MKTVHIEEGLWRAAKLRAMEEGVTLERVVNGVLAGGLRGAVGVPLTDREGLPLKRLENMGTVTYGDLDDTY